MNQGDIYWHTFRAPDKRRPVLILTRNSAVPFLTGITIAPLTTTIRGIPSEVLLTPAEDGVEADCVVNVDNIQTVQSRDSAHPSRTCRLSACAKCARQSNSLSASTP